MFLTSESSRLRALSMIFFVSSITDDGVAVKVGGACGGLWYRAGAMLTVESGREELRNEVEGLTGFN